MITADLRLARLAAEQHGMLTRRQAVAAGVGEGGVERRLAAGTLVIERAGVYRHAAHGWSSLGALHAAVLAGGEGAVASHRSAARLWRMRDVPRWAPEVTVAAPAQLRRPGLVAHRTDTLTAEDVCVVDGIPTTTPARTCLDLGAVLPLPVVRTAAEDAIVRKVVSEVDLVCALERLAGRGRRGSATLRAIVADAVPPAALESRLELALLRLIRSTVAEPPQLQFELVLATGTVRLDFAWPRKRIAVEADGRRWHSTTRDFERDLRRSNAITAAGWAHYRYGWNDVHRRSDVVRAELRATGQAAA